MFAGDSLTAAADAKSRGVAAENNGASMLGCFHLGQYSSVGIRNVNR